MKGGNHAILKWLRKVNKRKWGGEEGKRKFMSLIERRGRAYKLNSVEGATVGHHADVGGVEHFATFHNCDLRGSFNGRGGSTHGTFYVLFTRVVHP